MLIGLSGKKGSGKSTAAKYFEALGFERKSLANPIKRLVKEYYGLSDEILNDPVLKETYPLNINLDEREVVGLLDAIKDMYHFNWTEDSKTNIKQLLSIFREQPLKANTPRQILQLLGTEVFRRVSVNFWISLLESNLVPGRNYIVDDIRFDNEADFIKRYKGSLFVINRPGLTSQDSHASEGGIANVDKVIVNDSTIDALNNQLNQIAIELNIIKS